jgi:3-oxoacyl-[acyl-carrier-protein] synthase-3
MILSYHLPEKTLSNFELSQIRQDWTDEKIFSKTGIRSRHIASENESVLSLAEEACKKLFARGVKLEQIDFILFCTQTPEFVLPGVAGMLQDRLHLPKSIGALDYNLGCSGFVYGLSLAKGLIKGGVAKGVLLVTSETYSKHIAIDDTSSRAVFGDGAAVAFIDSLAAENIGEFLLGTDGSGAEKLVVKKGSPLFMDGPSIFNFALDEVPRTIEDVCRKNGVTIGDIDLFVFHQANKFILETLRKVISLDKEKFYVDMEDTGNTVSSTIPIALKRAEEKGVLSKGMKVMVVGFGVGLSWGATILKW